MSACACGCGATTWEGKQYVRGHHMRTPEARKRIALAKSHEAPPRDLTGQRFHKLTVLSWASWRQYSNGRESLWLCQCDCGKQPIVPQRNLVGGNTKSCGCIIGQHKRIHGASETPEFRIWGSMHSRCENPRHPSYPDYGGRGINVCERWSDFTAFREDMGLRPFPDAQIERVDNDGNYEPANCRWATRVEQGNNRRSSRFLTINGETKTLAQWEHVAGLRQGSISQRLRAGWAPEDVLVPSRLSKRA